jgi:hypothetical protein
MESRLDFGLPKKDRPRLVPLPGVVAEMLRRRMEAYSPATLIRPCEGPPSDERSVRI